MRNKDRYIQRPRRVSSTSTELPTFQLIPTSWQASPLPTPPPPSLLAPPPRDVVVDDDLQELRGGKLGARRVVAWLQPRVHVDDFAVALVLEQQA